MTKKTLSQLRDADFAQSLRESLQRFHKNNERPTSTQIIADALATRPARYYLTYRTVEAQVTRVQNISLRRRGAGISAARQQWVEIKAAVMRYLARNKTATIADAVNHVINFERPTRFYISERKARELFRKTLSRQYSFVS